MSALSDIFVIAHLGRQAVMRGGELVYVDGLPALSAGEIEAARPAAEAALAAELTPPAKRWPSAQEFADGFTDAELAAVSLSAHPVVAGLRFKLSTWRGEVHADDPRVIAGLAACVEAGVLTAERAAEITRLT